MKKTRPFVTTSGDYLSVLISLWLPRYGWTILLPIVLCAVCGFMFDERLLLVALMLLFIVVPMLMSFLYTYYMLAPEARRAVVRKEIEITEGESIRLIYLPSEEPEDDRRGRSRRMELPVGNRKEDEKPLPPLPVPAPETIGWDDVTGVKYTSRFTVYLLRGPRLNFLLIPHSAMPREAAV
ncbi:MAG: hypothetical protein K2H57_06100 [Duncaniella sp.]|nr:hypothetical protein [Duncaniella sp.]